nr:MAG TPA: hypothetical protein [Caudoviricetes sp.]
MSVAIRPIFQRLPRVVSLLISLQHLMLQR